MGSGSYNFTKFEAGESQKNYGSFFNLICTFVDTIQRNSVCQFQTLFLILSKVKESEMINYELQFASCELLF